jgi:hypothetical protein
MPQGSHDENGLARIAMSHREEIEKPAAAKKQPGDPTGAQSAQFDPQPGGKRAHKTPDYAIWKPQSDARGPEQPYERHRHQRSRGRMIVAQKNADQFIDPTLAHCPVGLNRAVEHQQLVLPPEGRVENRQGDSQ